MPGTTNFQVWNPNETNQETDAQYLADSQRVGGAVDNTPLPAPLGNKGFHQWSTFCAAFGKMMANKPGAYNTSDADVDVLAAVLSNLLTESDLGVQIISVPYSPTPIFNAASSNGFQMALTGNITSSTISGITPGQLLAFYFAQDSVGGRSISWPSSFVGALQPDLTPYAVSIQLFRADLSAIPRSASPMISNNYLFGITPPSGDSSTKIATTAFVTGGFTSGSSGGSYWQKDPNGLIRQWGTTSPFGSGSRNAQLAIEFPNPALFTLAPNIQCTPSTSPTGSNPQDSMTCYSVDKSTLGFTATVTATVNIGGSGASGISNVKVDWIATGY